MSAAGDWTNNGPPVAVQSLAVDPGAAGTAYAGTVAGLYRSGDHGLTWQRLASDFGGQSQTTALAVDPSNPSILYAASQRNGIFKSTDGGATFASSSTGLPPCYIGRIIIAWSDSSLLYISGNGCGVYRSTDSGRSWQQTSIHRNVYSLANHPSNSRRVFAGTDWGRANPEDVFAGIFVTDDGGISWRPVGGQPTPSNIVLDLQIDRSNPSKMYAALFGVDEIASSSNGGETWFRSSSGYLGYGASAIAIDPSNPSVLYVTAHNPPSVTGVPPPDVGGVYRSLDGGQTWSRFNDGQRPGEDLLAIEATGRFVYSANLLGRGVFVTETPAASAGTPSLGPVGKLALILALAAAGTLCLRRAI
jgi:photosystem II stability/assembly factor-like uncharacterized protein